MATAPRHHILIIVLDFNNNMYATIRMHQDMNYPEKVMATDLGRVNFAELAQSVGAQGIQVKTSEEFDVAFEEALNKKEPTVIEIITGKEQISVSSTLDQVRKKHC